MHDSAYHYAKQFFDNYWNPRFTSVTEIGNQEEAGAFEANLPVAINYTYHRKALTLANDPAYDTAQDHSIAAESTDVILASSFLHHDPFFWMTFLELVRALKPGGLLYVNVPSNHHFHRLPVDCWRFYPDAGLSLVQWAARNDLRVELAESFVAEPMQSGWADFVAVFHKQGFPLLRKGTIAENSRALNVHSNNHNTLARESGYTFDNIAAQEKDRNIALLLVEQQSISRALERHAINVDKLSAENMALQQQLHAIRNSWIGKISNRAQILSSKLSKRYLR